MYVTVYSDGPTRVLRFSDEPNISSSQAEQTILDLAARLTQARLEIPPNPADTGRKSVAGYRQMAVESACNDKYSCDGLSLCGARK